jgi:hypothetical protein
VGEKCQHGREDRERDMTGDRGAVGRYQAEYGAADETEDAGADGSEKRLSQWLLQFCKV